MGSEYHREWWRKHREEQYARRKERREWRSRTPLDGLDLALYRSKVEVLASGCHRWRGTAMKTGYGVFQGAVAHRVAYMTWKGPIPEGRQLDHLCRNPWCVNPEHLEPVFPLENVHRSVAARARPECKRGHSWAVHGVTNSQGVRVCRRCRAESSRKYDAKRSARRLGMRSSVDSGGSQE